MTGLMKFLFVGFLQLKPHFIIIALLSWTLYVLIRVVKNPGILLYWGFGGKNAGSAFLYNSIFCALVCAAFIIYGLYTKTYAFSQGLWFVRVLNTY